MYGTVTIVTAKRLYLKAAKRANFKISHRSSGFSGTSCPELLAWLPCHKHCTFLHHKKVLITRNKKFVTVYGDGC